MNLKKNIIILIAILVVFGGGYLLLAGNQSGDEPTATPVPTHTVISLETSKITGVTITAGGVSRKVERTESGWSMDGVDPSELSQSKMETLISTVSTVITKTKVADSAENPAEYGFDAPVAEVEIALEDGTSEKLTVGMLSPVLGDNFIMREGDPAVYTIYSYSVDTILKDISYYRQFERFSLNVENICRVLIDRRDDRDIELVMKEEVDMTYTVWELHKPYNGVFNAIDQFVDDKIIAKLTAVSLTEPAEKGLNYGLDNPYAILTVTLAERDANAKIISTSEMVVKVGNTVNGMTFVEYDGNVYQARSSMFDFIDTDEFLIVSKLQALVAIQNVDSVKVSDGEKTDELKITHLSDTEMTFKLNGKEADEKKTKAAYQALISLSADSEYKGEEYGECEYWMHYKGKGVDIKIEFCPIDELSYAIIRNGKIDFTIKKTKLAELYEVFGLYVGDPS